MKTFNLPRISIVMPSLNQSAFLEDAILSVLEQDYANKELIVIDGGSLDGSLDIIRRYDAQLTYWSSEPDRGQSHAINKGLALASGNIFNWLNSDDMLVPGSLSLVANQFVNRPNTHLVLGDNIFCDRAGRVIKISRPPTRWGYLPSAGVFPFGQQSAFFSTSWIRFLGGVREDLHYMMDFDLLYRHFYAQGTLERVKGLVGMWRHHNEAKHYCCRKEIKMERDKVFQGYGICQKAHDRAWNVAKLGRLLDGSYLQSYLLTRKLKGRLQRELSRC